MNTIKAVVGVLLFLAAVAFAGQGDYENAKMQEQLYCQNVADGVWPNYNPDIKCPATEEK